MVVKTVRVIHQGKRIDRHFTARRLRTPARSHQRWGILISIVVLVLAIGMMKYHQKPLQPGVLAIVNGHPVTMEDLQQFQRMMPMHLTTSQLIDQAINQQLLLQEAEKQGIIVSAQEVDVLITETLRQQNATVQDLQQALQKKHLTLTELREAYRQQLTISKLLQGALPQVTDEQVSEFYNQNQAAFVEQDPARAQEEIRAMLENQQAQTALPQFLSALRNRSDVRIAPQG